MMNSRQRFKLGAGAGLVTMLLGALMVLAPGAGANNQGGNSDVGLYDVADVSQTQHEQANTTTFVYEITGPEGEALSHLVVGGFCADALDDIVSVSPTPEEGGEYKVQQPTGALGYKIGGDPAVGSTITIVFDGLWDTDPDGSTWVLKKGPEGQSAPLLRAGPECETPPVECPAGTTWVDANEDQIVTSDECETPPVECPAGTTWVDANEDQIVTSDECETPTPGPEPTPTPVSTLRIVKLVDSADPGDLPEDGWSVDFEVDDTEGGLVDEVLLTDGNATSSAEEVDAATYTITELVNDDSQLVDVECLDAELESAVVGDPDLDGRTVSVAVGSDEDITCTFTNFYAAQQVLPEEEEPGTITIVKAVTGPAPESGWAFGFDVSDGVGRVVLTDADNDATFTTVEAGKYTIAEDANTATSLESIACTDPDAVSNGRTVSIDVGEGEDVVCTFTNAFPAAEVLGVQTVRTLPRTGDETRNLAGVGALMLAMGAAMVLGSKRQLARR